jgi:hypothetical protein
MKVFLWMLLKTNGQKVSLWGLLSMFMKRKDLRFAKCFALDIDENKWLIRCCGNLSRVSLGRFENPA